MVARAAWSVYTCRNFLDLYTMRDFFQVICKEVLFSQLLGVFNTSISQNVPLVNRLPINVLIKAFPSAVRGGPIQQILIGCPLCTSLYEGSLTTVPVSLTVTWSRWLYIQ